MKVFRVSVLAVLALVAVPAAASAQTGLQSEIDSWPVYAWVAVEFGLIGFIGFSLLAMFPEWMTPAVETARGGWIVSLAVGAVLYGALFLVGMVIPVVPVVFELAWGTVGYVAAGAVLVGYAGRESIALGVLLGAILSGLFVVIPIVGPVGHHLLFALGVGASVRVSLGDGGVNTSDRDDPPPATRV